MDGKPLWALLIPKWGEIITTGKRFDYCLLALVNCNRSKWFSSIRPSTRHWRLREPSSGAGTTVLPLQNHVSPFPFTIFVNCLQSVLVGVKEDVQGGPRRTCERGTGRCHNISPSNEVGMFIRGFYFIYLSIYFASSLKQNCPLCSCPSEE